MNLEEVWRRKSDKDVFAAVQALADFSDAGQKVILAEAARRPPLWTCDHCREHNEDRCDECENCGTRRDGLSPTPVSEVDSASPSAQTSTSSCKVVPFIGRISTGFFSASNAGTVAQQLAAAIDSATSDGWRFHSFAKADIEVTPGCIAGLLGAKTSYITFDQLIFVRDL